MCIHCIYAYKYTRAHTHTHTRYDKKYVECLHKIIITVKDTLPLMPPSRYYPMLRTHLSHRSCHFLKQFWKSSFVSVFSCAVVAALMS